MKSIILISGAVIFLMILFFAMGYLKKLRKAFDRADVKNFSGTDAERIVNAYRTEEGYLKRRTRVWLLTIALEAAVVLTTFGSVYYLANKDRWAAERELAERERTQTENENTVQDEQELLKILLEEKQAQDQERILEDQKAKQALAEGVPLKIFRYKQKRLKKAQKNVEEALADYRKVEKKLAEAQKQNAKNSELLKKADSLLAQKNDVSKSQAVSLKNELDNITYADIPAVRVKLAKAQSRLDKAKKNLEYIENKSVGDLKVDMVSFNLLLSLVIMCIYASLLLPLKKFPKFCEKYETYIGMSFWVVIFCLFIFVISPIFS